ncbi:MAG: LytTR family DNA-binding domain-containing protein [Bacteroidia bacterium]|jgi:two-component system LytT family response regulator|nr:LytTR family DNA-binding domain-containing protein [Bacteroidia bacterium]
MMNLILLDDEPLALVLLRRHLADLPDWTLLGAFTDAEAAAACLREQPVDLLVTDINMPDISGLQFVRDLPEMRPLVIFVTAYREHAVTGFDLDVVDYVVKPVSQERFHKALHKAADLLRLRRRAEAAGPPPEDPYLSVFSEYQQLRLLIRDIRYIEAMGDYVKIYLATQPRPILTLERMKHLTERLTPRGFRRIHRSWLVNLDHVTATQKSRVRVGEVWLPVGETYQ